VSVEGEKGAVRIDPLMPGDVRDYLTEHPDFLAENDDLLTALVPPMRDRGAKVEDFQRFMLTRLQDNFLAIKDEHDDLLRLMQDHMQRQNRVNAALLAMLDAETFADLLRTLAEDGALLLDHAAVRLFLASDGVIDEGDYGSLRVVPPDFIGRWLVGRDLVLEEQTQAAPDLFGELEDEIRSRALIRLSFAPGVPQGLLALGHSDPFYYSTGLATEQVETLAAVFERCVRRFLI
jgi:uncharacterized protein YigA (DUF484 family)